MAHIQSSSVMTAMQADYPEARLMLSAMLPALGDNLGNGKRNTKALQGQVINCQELLLIQNAFKKLFVGKYEMFQGSLKKTVEEGVACQ